MSPKQAKLPAVNEAQLKELHLNRIAQEADIAAKYIKEQRVLGFMMVIITEEGAIATLKTARPGEIAPFDDIETMLTNGCTPQAEAEAEAPAPTVQ